ncbi:MAG: hypothetical protein M1358_14830 [Chloroflexi bacterium]|nr:hypothetical protein [Chloroflexota bacterium]
MPLITILVVVGLILALLDLFPIIPAKIPFLTIAVILLAIALLLMTGGIKV